MNNGHLKPSLTNTIADAGEVVVHRTFSAESIDVWNRFIESLGIRSPSYRSEWLAILRDGLCHVPYCLEVQCGGHTQGLLPLVLMHSRLFGRFLVGLPYLNVGGVMARDQADAQRLIEEAVMLADSLDVRYLELRHESPVRHPSLNHESSQKVHMRLDLPQKHDALWNAFRPKVRNQIRKAEKNELKVVWGGDELLRDFYSVFSKNMRDLGTPVFGRRLFAAMLAHLDQDAEICVVRAQDRAVAAAIVIHGNGISEVPSASSLRELNHFNGNMLLYWHLLHRAMERGQQQFDFGRSSIGSNTHRFKAQWGATPHPAVWQYYVRQGSVGEMRPDHPANQRKIAIWRRLPVWLTRIVGPHIVRGIP